MCFNQKLCWEQKKERCKTKKRKSEEEKGEYISPKCWEKRRHARQLVSGMSRTIRALHAQAVGLPIRRPMQPTRETLIQPFYHDRNFPTIGIRGQITCHLPLHDHPRARRDRHPSRRLRIARLLYAVARGRKHLFYYISFNRKCVFEFVSDIRWRRRSIQRRSNENVNESVCSRREIGTERVKSVMWEIKYVPREKIDDMSRWIFRIFRGAAFTYYLLCEKTESDGITRYPCPHSFSTRERI